MELRTSSYLGTMFIALVGPGTAVAQTVTTAPFGHAPAIGLPAMVLVALALGVGAVYLLRHRSPSVRLVAVAAAMMLASIAYATVSVEVSGPECDVRTTHTWNPLTSTSLDNQCSNALLIVALELDCISGTGMSSTIPDCVVGATLEAGASCALPLCI